MSVTADMTGVIRRLKTLACRPAPLSRNNGEDNFSLTTTRRRAEVRRVGCRQVLRYIGYTMTETVHRQRATSMEELDQLMPLMFSREGIAKGLRFQPRPTDVIIACYSKSGTTWLQQIVHGLRTRGDMEFDDISRVVPWIETADDLGIDLDAEQTAKPRAFKSHVPYSAVPKGCRYIVSVRHPADVLVSFYHFFENWWFQAGAISVEEFAHKHWFVRGREAPEGGDYWNHFCSWWAMRDDPSVLFLAYEHMKQDLAGTVRRVAEFLEIPLDDELLEIVSRQASFDFMLAHKDRFDLSMIRRISETVVGLPAGSDSSQVRQGDVGSHKTELSDELCTELNQIWTETVAAEHGLASYADALAQIE